jgi:hypothetical protein
MNKQNDGQTPKVDRIRYARRKRNYLAGQFRNRAESEQQDKQAPTGDGG